MSERRIVQIATAVSATEYVLTALADDGTVWLTKGYPIKWQQILALPEALSRFEASTTEGENP